MLQLVFSIQLNLQKRDSVDQVQGTQSQDQLVYVCGDSIYLMALINGSTHQNFRLSKIRVTYLLSKSQFKLRVVALIMSRMGLLMYIIWLLLLLAGRS